MDISNNDYSAFDISEIIMFLFHPRPEWRMPMMGQGTESHMIPVESDVAVGARFYLAAKSSPNILFFHGNGEIVADYEEVGLLFTQMGINFLPVDYRGYGQSTGRPTVTAMMQDAHVIFAYVRNWLKEREFTGRLCVMGRSLGSAPALDLAFHYPRFIDGLIIESGFAYISPLLRLIGVDPSHYGLSEEQGPRNLDKIRQWDKPLLVIHAEYDQIISYAEGLALYEASPAADKKLLMIPNATHNDIFFQGMNAYLQAVGDLAHRTAADDAPSQRE
ncbi:MAG: alpha/beta hydrolase [Syntrophus sp. (in: bacteria)]|nr:alpha/beta hydrolase [Syntrophus sp. (in: bacteria)]